MKKLLDEKSGMILKLFVYQIAMSLLGVFIVSPFSDDRLCVIAGIFSMLFYFSLISYAIVEDGQRDCISVNAGRSSLTVYTGLKYALVSYIPTIVISLFYSILRLFTPEAALSALKAVLNIIIRFFLMGMYIGIDAGLTGYNYDSVNHIMVSDAPEWIRFLSDNGLIFAICLLLMPAVSAVSYALAYKGKVHINTAEKTKKKKIK